jgi:hypothetical protein
MLHISQQPEFAEVTQEVNSLGEAQGKVLARLAEVESLLRAGTPDDGSSYLDSALQFAATGKVIAPINISSELHDSHLILRQQRDALAQAIKQKQQAHTGVQRKLSREACTQIAPAHRKLAARYLEALRQLDAIAEEEISLFRSIEVKGYDVSMREYIAWPHMGMIRETSSSAIWHKVRELSRYVG